MMNLKTVFGGVLVFFLVSSCVSYREFQVQIFKPSDFALPAGTKDITLVARNLKYKNDTLQHYFVRNHQLVRDKSFFDFDSLAISTCLDSLAGCLRYSGNPNSVTVLPNKYVAHRRVDEVRPASPEWYQTVSVNTNANVLISLDMFSCFYSNNDGYESGGAKVVTSNIWSVYNVASQKIVDRFLQVDTLYWNKSDDRKLNIPGKTDAIKLAAGVIGTNYAKHLLPGWVKVNRNYMVCNDENIQKAVKLAQNNKWKEATELWQICTQNKDKLIKTAAFYNLALASEMNGDISTAIELSARAANLCSGVFMSSVNRTVREYVEALYQRKNDIEKLNLQYGLK
jgi:hypothetical protein